MEEKAEIYLVVSQTGTLLSKIIRAVTKEPYNHISIALQEDLQEMYSFGRVRTYNPVWGGFVMESPDWGTFKRFKNTKVKLLRMEITKKEYDCLREILQSMYNERQKYHYNYIGLATAYFKVPWKQQNCYYCSEFVRDILVQCDIVKEEEFDQVVKPNDFVYLDIGTEEIYEGNLQEYAVLQRSPLQG